MSLYSDYETDESTEKQGVWVEYSPNKDETVPAFKVARLCKTNQKYQKLLEARTRPHRRAIEVGTISEKVAEDIYLGVFIDSIVVDTRNLQDRKGKAMKGTKEELTELFKALPELYEDLAGRAKSISLFRSEAVEDEAKN